MNIYDKAHDLASALKNSPEFKEYKDQYIKVMADSNKKERIQSYTQKIMDYQVKYMGKEEEGQEDLERLQSLQESLVMDPEIANYIQVEANFARTFNEVNNIIAEAITIQMPDD